MNRQIGNPWGAPRAYAPAAVGKSEPAKVTSIAFPALGERKGVSAGRGLIEKDIPIGGGGRGIGDPGGSLADARGGGTSENSIAVGRGRGGSLTEARGGGTSENSIAVGRGRGGFLTEARGGGTSENIIAVEGRGRCGPSTESRGRGRGGRGRGRVSDRLNPDFLVNQLDSCDFVKSRPSEGEDVSSKKGEAGKKVDLVTNFFALSKLTNFNLFHYHVEFKPDLDRTDVRKQLVKLHEPTLGAFIFDGQSFFTPHRIMLKPMELYSTNPFNSQKIQISLKLVAEISPVEPIFLQVYNIIFRNVMTILNLELLGRFYYDPKDKVTIPSRKLEVWPGYITSARNHENGVLLNVEVTHKVVRSDSVLHFISGVKSSYKGDFRREITKQLLGSIVLTRYNKKNYKIDDIKWDITPREEFPLKRGGKKSYIDYYYEQYKMVIKDSHQPMLVSLPKKKDYHRGSSQPIYLVPELCQMTGLNDGMRKDFNLMKELTGHLCMSPSGRIQKTKTFIERWYADKKIVDELQRWNIEITRKPVNCRGRVLDMDDIIIGPKMAPGNLPRLEKGVNGDWGQTFKSKPMLSCVPLKQWILIVPPACDQAAEQLVTSLRATAKAISFVVDNPMIKFRMSDTRPSSYSVAIQNIYDQLKGKLQMVVVLLPSNNAEVYAAIKKKTYIDLGVACQCIVVKTLVTKNVMSICSRLAIQMNAKLGGEPWTVQIPLRNMMVIGYDVFHSPNRRNPSVGALVASTSDTLAKYFTCTHFHKNRNELSANLCSAMTKALLAYHSKNQVYPARILLYRDGVGDGQLSYIYNTELSQIQDAIRTLYSQTSTPPPKFSFVVVTKRIHTRIFVPQPGGEGNAVAGTVVDDVVTLPERYDFFLVSQNVNTSERTVSPTSYNVLVDEQGLNPDRMQRLTLKMCHLYYNYTGTIAVPAPCQYAHKLAYITGQSLFSTANEKLENQLYFL